MTDEYAAGLVDGEGSISIVVFNRRGRSPLHRVVVDVTIAHEGVLREFQAAYGGSVRRGRRRKLSDAHIWSWRLAGAASAKFLRAIRPHMIVKGQQADLALEYEDTRVECRGRPYGIPAAELARREVLRQRMWLLNGSYRSNRKALA